MNLETYAKAVTRTVSDKFVTDIVTPTQALVHLLHVETIAQGLDGFKKALFYGKAPKPKVAETILKSEKYIKNELHFLMGMVTEVGELSEVLRASWGGTLEDETKVIDELGDLMWYVVNFANERGINLETVMEANIAKLKARFPEKFTDSAAIERNESNESVALKSAL